MRLTLSHLLYGIKLLSIPDAIPTDGDQKHESSMNEKFRYLSKVRAHFLNRHERVS